MTPEVLAARALAWLGIPADRPGPDTDQAPHVAAAVAAWVSTLPATRRRATTDDAGATTWPADTQHGAVMLAARIIRRRNTPSGLESFSSDSATYVARYDPDVSLLLRTGTAAYPAIG